MNNGKQLPTHFLYQGSVLLFFARRGLMQDKHEIILFRPRLPVTLPLKPEQYRKNSVLGTISRCLFVELRKPIGQVFGTFRPWKSVDFSAVWSEFCYGGRTDEVPSAGFQNRIGELLPQNEILIFVRLRNHSYVIFGPFQSVEIRAFTTVWSELHELENARIKRGMKDSWTISANCSHRTYFY